MSILVWTPWHYSVHWTGNDRQLVIETMSILRRDRLVVMYLVGGDVLGDYKEKMGCRWCTWRVQSSIKDWCQRWDQCGWKRQIPLDPFYKTSLDPISTEGVGATRYTQMRSLQINDKGTKKSVSNVSLRCYAPPRDRTTELWLGTGHFMSECVCEEDCQQASNAMDPRLAIFMSYSTPGIYIVWT
jgi:hypothetical protein